MKTDKLFSAVMRLDLEPIKRKLMHVPSGEGWSGARANAVEKEYRRFLYLMNVYPHEDIAPLVDVDTFWHYHILDTMKYAADCEQAFGHFLHHYPYVGMRGGDDEQFRLDSGTRMRDLYEATFGDAYPDLHDEAMAYCAGPESARPIVLGTATAYCAGPESARAMTLGAATAYCAGPESARPVMSRATAYCAGPESARSASAIAYCAGPESARPASAIAYCAGPESVRPAGRQAIRAAVVAYCAGPESRRMLAA